MNNMLCTTSCPTFYNTTCPNALKTIRTTIRTAVSRERRMAALLIRLHFHDCFVQGCDASILLNDTTPNERGTLSNSGVGGYEVIDAAKAAVERICPGVVSCADILAVAARDASVAVGGPSWKLRLGRRDSTTTNPTEADRDLPRGDQDLDSLIRNFANKGRIYSNTTNLDPGFGSTRRRNCPPAAPEGNTNLAPLDLVTPNSFDNNYFRNLLRRRGLLISDQVLFNGGSSDNIVLEYVNNPSRFRSDFAAAMIKMGNIELLTGNNGGSDDEIRVEKI
ncbi:hypothetical protein Ccrd_000397 [Cynara cardunculus var. scolymus]|uniref:peroxidase n=1 Tax=Cynara cardunculus var. scolymus TaxID=59895 RepID=A0A103XVA5_CYNCS|nr:hypothetical protein Ccrd_000397 [Cynara cardunculus var. scolymus]